jgi:hypothetical protein
VRAANRAETFRRFAGALRRCAPGVQYELVLALKGFSEEREAAPYLAEVRDLNPEVLFFPDTGFDLGVYFAAASRLGRSRYCFLNSFAEPLAEGWLAHLETALALSDVGMASATGSWNSPRSWALYSLGLPSPYRGLMPSRGSAREQFAQLDAEREPSVAGASAGAVAGPSRVAGALLRLPRAAVAAVRAMPMQLREFESFPAHHLRTNAFAMAHSTLAELKLHRVIEKSDAYVLESGRDSLTRQVQRRGLRAVVVDRAGGIYDQDEWHRSLTFWQRSQEGLMVADNQTRSYQRGGPERRQMLSTMAWGPSADAG